jgi:hypothetical protein
LRSRQAQPCSNPTIPACPCRTASIAAARAWLVVKEHKAVYDFDHTQTESGSEVEQETILLPLSADGKAVDHVLIYLEAGRRKGWW